MVFDQPRIADYRLKLMTDADLREKMGQAGRQRAVELLDYRKVAERFLQIISDRMGIA